ncbi:MAG: IPT/TIG domain-containing protein [Acidobacteria bacterium]|nr:IPT/TIG domain-containing protein [Acidobacteriota bacterium]MCW5967886.1 IPT/TIG domain-containing protein [Blastocatellales bacterium]
MSGITLFLLLLFALPPSFNPAKATARAKEVVQCQHIITPATQSFAARGGAGNLTVLTTGGCTWSATSNAPWINILSLNSGAAVGRLNYLVLPNTNVNQRTGVITAAGRSFALTQAGTNPSSCDAVEITIGQTINGALTPDDCLSSLRIQDGAQPVADRYTFNAASGQPVTISVASEEFDTYIYLVDPDGSMIAQNDDSTSGSGSRIPGNKGFLILPASGKFTVEVTSFSRNALGSYSLNVSTPAGGCTYAISSAGQAFTSTGGTDSVNVNTQQGCAWEAASNNGWITVDSNGSSGPGSVGYTVSGNTGVARTGSVTIAGLTFIVAQAGSNGSGCPVISGVNPAEGNPGDSIVITGSNFTGATSVRYTGGVAAPFILAGDSQITAKIPGNASTGPVSVIKPACTDAATPAVTVNRLVVSVSAASFLGASLAGDSIAAAFGTGLATDVAVAGSLPLPTSLLGTTVKVRDGSGVERTANLFFVAPGQINYQIPEGTLPGAAKVTVTSGDGTVSTGTMAVASVAPGIFAANASGQGPAAASVLRAKSDGTQILEAVARFEAATNAFVTVPIDFGPDLGANSDQLFLILYGTGMRYRSTLSAVACLIHDNSAEILYTGSQGVFLGLDQINVRLSRELAGRGEVDVFLIVDGRATNSVRINLK